MGAQVAAFPDTVAVLEADPDLGRALDPEVRVEAARFVRARSTVLSPGSWDPSSLINRPGGVGILVLNGLLVRDVLLVDTRCSELIAGGDVIEPRDAWNGERLVPVGVDWTVVEEARVAILDARFMATAARWPGLLSALFERVSERSFRLATHAAICQLGRVELRLLALMWHLSERWGRVTPSGIVLPLKVSHATLGRLVGSRRPTVTLALKELHERGEVTRREDGSWLLEGEPPEELCTIAESEPATRRVIELIPPEPGPPARPSRFADPEALHERFARLKEAYRRQEAHTNDLAARVRAVRAHASRRRSEVRSADRPPSSGSLR